MFIPKSLPETKGEDWVCDIELAHLRIDDVAFDESIAKARHIRNDS